MLNIMSSSSFSTILSLAYRKSELFAFEWGEEVAVFRTLGHGMSKGKKAAAAAT